MQGAFVRLARYNRWANARLFAACGELDEVAYYAVRAAFFGSIHRTLNHILLADRAWQSRIDQDRAPNLPLDTELYQDRDELRLAREAEDLRLLERVSALDAAGLARRVGYRNSSGKLFENEVGDILQHVFNHQTHHRGQVHGMLSATNVAPPPLDLIFFMREP